MRYETVTESFIQLPEKSAIVKNMDSRTAVVLKIVDSQTRQVLIFPNQSAKYANCDAYVKTETANRKVRVQITPLKVVDPSGEEITVPGGEGKYLPLTGGTLTGNLNVNANLYVQNKKIEPVTFATDAQTKSMLDVIFGS